jgi:hypothetical protein
MIVGKKIVGTAKGLEELEESFLVIEIKRRKAVTPVIISKELKRRSSRRLDTRSTRTSSWPHNRRT